jgi:formimidoylglutamate deiminase
MNYWLERALLPSGWAHGVRVSVDDVGVISAVEPSGDRSAATILAGAAIPGMQNCHSHAFQRVMAGFAEKSASNDDFWSWRKLMYGLAAKMTPDDLHVIASQLYVEMLKAGYTAVAEFHYLHDPRSHDHVLRMSEAITQAAAQVGIRHTHLPVLYQNSDFGGKAAQPEQQRFVIGIDSFLRLLNDLDARRPQNPQQIIGIAFHSLRAVQPEAITQVLQHCGEAFRARPIHLHIAEQLAEVDTCIAWCGQRPVQWLLNHVDVDARWCLVHATHTMPSEVEALAKSKAVVCLCPTTEANLGDGIFALQSYLAADGVVAIGSDSHVSVSPVEELRWLEYAQRLNSQRRCVTASSLQPHTGSRLWSCALQGGALAIGHATGAIAAGYQADFIVIDTNSAALFGTDDEWLLDRFIFSGNANLVRQVIVAGKQVVRDGRHALEERIASDFFGVLKRLREQPHW